MDVRFPTGLVLAISTLAIGQQPAEQKKETPPAEQQKPAPLFGGKLDLRSSKRTKESATLGFNGIDPSGKVDQKMLGTQVTSADEQKAKTMGDPRPSGADLSAFAQEGGLNKK